MKKLLRFIVFVLLALGFLFLAGCPGGTTTTTSSTTTTTTKPGRSASVETKNFSFSPATVTIQKGGKVTWTNKDSVNHTVTADKGEFESGQLTTDKSFSHTFNEAGTFKYHCSNHPYMTGEVVVK